MGPDMVALHVETHNWDQAFILVEKNPTFAPLVYLPYAEWLAENDKFVEAQKGTTIVNFKELNFRQYIFLFLAFLKGGRPERAFKVLQILTENAVNEQRYQDAGYYYWLLSRQYLNLASNR